MQNASLIAEIPFNWTIANTRYGIISVHVVASFSFQSVLQKSAEISVRSTFKKCAISFLKHKNLDKMRKRL